MPALSAADLATYRSGAPVVEYYLAVMPRLPVWKGRLNNSEAGYSLTSLEYDATLEGDANDIVAGQTMLVYASDGTTYKGKVRVRSVDIPNTTVTVSGNDDIEWADDDVLLVIYVFEPWSKPTGLEDDDGGIKYLKDNDIEWSDNDTSFPPKANDMGAFAGFLNDAGYVDVLFNANASSAMAAGATIASYNRPAEDGAYTVGNAGTAQGTIRFSDVGFRWITETVTDTNGKTGVHRMPIWTFGDGYQPFKEFEITRRIYDGRDGELVIEAFGNNITPDDVPENTMCVLFTITKINGSELSVNGRGKPFEGRANIDFVGWIMQDSVRWDPEEGHITFTIGTLGKVADEMQGFSTFITDVDSGDEDSWHTGVDLTVQRVIHFLLEWHTNINDLAYIEISPNETIAGRKFPQAAPFKQIENAFLTNKGVFAHLGVSRYSSVHIRYDPQELSDADRATRETVINMTSQDWLTELSIDKSHRPRVSSMWGGGIYYDGTDGTPFRARAPGKVGKESGREARGDNLIILGQSDLNSKLGRAFAAAASPWETDPIECYYDIFEPALQEYITITISESENPRGYAFDTDTKWVVRRVEIEDNISDAPLVRVVVERLAEPFTAVSLPIPEGPPEPEPPPIPEPPEPPPDPLSGDWVVLGTTGAGVCYTRDAITGVPPTFYQYNDVSGGGSLDDSIIYDLVMDPNNPARLAVLDGNNDVYVVESWYGLDEWVSKLTSAGVLSDHPSATSSSIEQLATGSLKNGTTYLAALVSLDVGLVDELAVYLSYDWGNTWTMYLMDEHGYGSWRAASCGWTGFFDNEKTRDVAARALGTGNAIGGQMIAVGEKIFVSGRSWASTTGRSQVIYLDLGLGPAWVMPCYIPSTHVPPPTCTCGTNLNNGLGGRSVFDWTNVGPFAVCESRMFTERLYLAHYKVHEDVDVAEPICVIYVSPAGSSTIVEEHTTGGLGEGLGYYPGQMFAAPYTVQVPWIGVRCDEDVDGVRYTYLYLGDVSEADRIELAQNAYFRVGESFPYLVNDIWTVSYLGRSWVNTEDIDAPGETNDDLFLVSKKLPAFFCQTFADHSGNLEALGALGITKIVPDPSR